MITDETIIEVKNRDNGSISYNIPDLNNLYRYFEAGETKKVPMVELRKLSWTPGGEALLKDYLIVNNQEAVDELLGSVEPEYFYTEEDVKNLLLTGSLDELKDCLDFAPEGTKDLVKKLAVDLELNDIKKRQAILEMTGFNVTSAIAINAETKEDNAEETKHTRRANTTLEEKKEENNSTPTRRVIIKK